jgi:peptidoglycan/LPS O-acetylase OafA/YrhL
MNSFKPEIAGLRAIAVAIVIFFHLKLDLFQGGFIGVDVFFVISGYLITRNILRDARADLFSFKTFYVRRARRIFPALIFTVVVTYLTGALWCSPLMFLDLAKECTHALLSIANIQYWRESHKYFAPNSDQLALLHFWSLSVEEQFYLVWPGLLIFAKRIKKIWEVLALVAIISFVASIAEAHVDSSATFFLTPFRMYEFCVGALVLAFENVSTSQRFKEIASGLGIVGIVASAIAFRSSMPQLQFAMLAPCVGAAAVIFAGRNTWATKIITMPPFLWVGAISYSLYLCHWPIIFFARFLFGEAANTFIASTLLLIAMLASAVAMYIFIERRFVHSPGVALPSFKKTSIQFWSTVVVLVAITHATFLFRGFEWRLPLDSKRLARLQGFPDGEDMAQLDGPVVLALVGDSHAIQYDVGLSILLHRFRSNMDILASPGCPMLYGISVKSNLTRSGCITVRDRALNRLGMTDIPIIFDQFWSFYDDATIDSDFIDETSLQEVGSYNKLHSALDRTMAEFVKGGRRVLLIGSQVDANCHFDRARLYQGPLPHAAMPPCLPASKEVSERAGARMNALLEMVQAKWPNNITLLRPVDYLCDSECPTMSNGLWLYFDGTHFTVAGSKYMVQRAEIPLKQFLALR